ncbi:bifunctional glycosyltransferase 87/phosphatase PAP2 family protein [Streptomyces sp. H27-D2]|uniref:bifunctional glycosyltransferase 87/phosphatase PAP2 family protein n=1 Tax=Streptomyces sp. H27-D2 TaxID=3046304 RepID=UPI002DB8581C|nr:bifunctional glycosyltransferase 87/phosphatase PAP2 family protein [Streptomyces sp. H27-D2]MEC4016224.1 bifunctional glycosyltransferase 87/phosphatase PAP2 family protein [Streptomyces sp. H27-D2]
MGNSVGAEAGTRGFVVQAGLWLLAGLLAARQAAAVLRLPPGERLTDLETWTGENGVLHVAGSLYDTDQFTGTPFAGLVLKPLTRAAEQSLGVVWTFGTLLLVAVLGVVAARALPGPISRRASLTAVPVAISLLVLSLPVRNAFSLGQASVIPVLLVLLGCLWVSSEHRAGVLIGLAAALQPAVLLFAPLLWFTGRKRAALTAGGTFAGLSALAWAALPHDSWTYWVHHVAGVGLGEPADSLANQSLHGLLLRIGLQGPLELILLGVLAVAVVGLGLRRAVTYARDGQLLLAVTLTGCVAVAVSPTAWRHQLLWVLLAVVGRVGRRGADRLVWPVLVIMVMTVNSGALMPNIVFLRDISANAPLLLAVAAACLVPFVPRTAPEWARPVPKRVAKPVQGRFTWVPLLRFWRQTLNRPNLLLELLLIRVGYSAYSAVRLPAGGARDAAEQHGWQIVHLERWLHIDVEHWFNHLVVRMPSVQSFMGFAYSTFHFLFPLALLAWMYIRRPAMYRWARTALGFATLLALIGFWFYPLAPPRLMPGLGFIDTVHGTQDLASPEFGALTEVSNQYAAMPSLHVGWSMWCAVVFALLVPWMWLRVAGFLYPLMTTLVIVGTANHYVLDAVGGAVVVGAGFALQYVLTGPRRKESVGESAGSRLDPDADPGAGPVADRDRPVSVDAAT